MYDVELSTEALKIFRAANKALAKKVARCFEYLEQNPRSHPNIKPLKGNLAGYYRYRIGDYRVVYSVDDQKRLVMVVAIAHRKDVYE
jgi:mRNA interferase RelE/StbE